MKLLSTPIAGVMVADTRRLADHRGSFTRLFCEEELAGAIGNRHIVQINHSRTEQIGAVRGMHFQHAPHAEMKMVRCLRGAVWDVAVDLRPASPTWLKWHAVELTPENGRMMIIPEGCAHGFQVLKPGSELLYLHTAFYAPEAEGGVRLDDPALGIKWPLAVSEMSERDSHHAPIDDAFCGVKL